MDTRWLDIMCYATVRKTGPQPTLWSDVVEGRGLPYKSLADIQPDSHSLVTMSKLGILVAVAVFLETVSATSVSVTSVSQ